MGRIPKPVYTITGNSGGSIRSNQASGNLNLQGVSGVSVAGSGDTLIISGSGSSGGLTWNDAATTITMTSNNGYVVTSGAQVFTLPTTSAFGDSLQILLNGGTSWRLAQAAGQSVVINAAISSVGIGGSIQTNTAGLTISLICISANTKWQTTSLLGNPTVV